MHPTRKIVLASRNHGKVREIASVLDSCGVEVVGLDDLPRAEEIPEPEETGATFADNARDKAVYYARATGMWCLADDSGLVVDALAGAPGVRSARYAEENFPPGADRSEIDKANNAKLLRELASAPEGAGAARFVCCLALSDGREILLESTGAIEGVILRQPRGANGFGYDPVFFVPAIGQTAAEMPPEQKNAISHRGLATREFARRLKPLLQARAEGEAHA